MGSSDCLTFYLDQRVADQTSLEKLRFIPVINHDAQCIIYECVAFALYEENSHYFVGYANSTVTKWIEMESLAKRIGPMKRLKKVSGSNIAALIMKKTELSRDEVGLQKNVLEFDNLSLNEAASAEWLAQLQLIK